MNRILVPLLLTACVSSIIDQPAPLGERTSGLGDLLYTAFLSPKDPVGPLTLGIGPALQLPTATDSVLGTGKWALGPSAVALTIAGPWVIGALVTNLWSFAGKDQREDVRSLLVQPFINYNLPNGWAVGTSPIVTANWERSGKDRWTVPLGATVSKVIRVEGAPPLSVNVGAFWNVARPNNGADGQIRATVALLLPR